LSVIQEYLKGWTGSISTDGYVAYKAFTSNQPGILHAGCWAHARRLYVESLVSDHTSSMGMIETIAELFNIEYNCSLLNLSPEERRLKRRKSSRPILAKIYAKARAISKDILLMANPTLAKAVNYTLNAHSAVAVPT
ncbi:MAG: IS66 family transposase, partial [Phocaeicola sp.]